MESLSERFGKYHVLGRIAQGGMAEIYKVKTVGIAGFEKVQALKRMRPKFAREPRFIRSFIDEARIAVELNHRNIVQVFEFGKANGELFLAMELIEGVDLRTVLTDAQDRDIDLPVPLACFILAEIATGLDYAHRKSDHHGRSLAIVHCDVSPQNVMLSYEGYVKVLDFGVARARFGAQQTTRRLRGKPRYMAPEQTMGRNPTPATDVFALGVVAWELLTGLPLFEGKTLSEILASVRRADAPPVDRINPDVPAKVAAAVGRALSPDPMARGTAGELSTILGSTAQLAGDQASARTLSEWLRAVYGSEPHTATMPALTAPLAQGSTLKVSVPPPAPAMSRDVIGPLLSSSDASSNASLDPEAPGARAISLDEDPDAEVTATGVAVRHLQDTPTEAGVLAAAPRLTERIESIDDDTPMPRLFEKRRVVALAALVEGGDAELRRLLAAVLGHLAYKHDAVVHSQGEDGVVAVFGLEVAGEDDVANAMSYALHAVETARDARPQGHDESLRVRIAARAGVVATRDRGGYRLVGDAVEELRALARSAEPGRPLLGGSGGRLTSAYYAFRERADLRRHSRRMGVFELIGPRTFDERNRVLHGRSDLFVGRRQELDTLGGLLERVVRQRSSAIAAVIGAMGVGKSRLITELVARANVDCDPPPMVVAVAATPVGQVAPFSQVIELVQTSLNLPPGRGEAARGRLVKRLRESMARADLEPRDRDEVTSALELAMELRDGSAPAPSGGSLMNLRERVSAAVRTYHRLIMPPRQPLLVVLEDLHFADRTSIEVLQSVMRSPVHGAELILLTTRPQGEPDLPQPDAVDARIHLDELGGEELEHLVRDRLRSAANPRTIAAVTQRAGGNPLFVEQVAEAVREADWTEIPSNVRALILAQVDRLPARTKAVLQHAAVAGLQFGAGLLHELLGDQIGEPGNPPVHEEIEQLCSRGLLRRVALYPDSGDGEVTFARGLIREVIYDSLSASARRETHARVGKLLASRYRAGRDEVPATIAEHLQLGGEMAAAAAFWLRAGRVALAAFDASAAVERFSRTLAIDEMVAARQPSGARESAAALARRREALAGREQAYRLLGDHEAQGRDLAELERLAWDEPRLLADVESRVAARLLRLGDLQGALAAAERAHRAALGCGDERGAALALCISGEVYERMGAFDDSIERNRAAQAIFRGIEAGADEIRALIGIGRALITRAHYEEAQAVYHDLIERVEESGDPWLERLVRNHVAGIYLVLGHFEEAMASARRSLGICRRYGDRAREGDNLSVCGTILLQLGRLDEARDHFDRALHIHDRTGSLWSRADCLVYAGATEARLGAHDRSMAYLSEAVSTARGIGARYIEANALVALARALLQRDQPGDIERARQTAAEATSVAHAAALIGPEIQGLSCLAETTWRAGAPQDALSLSTHAVALLDQQKYVEGSEEEILYLHHQLLDMAGKADAAGKADGAAVLARARASMQRKLDLIEDPDWRRAFVENVPVNTHLAEGN